MEVPNVCNERVRKQYKLRDHRDVVYTQKAEYKCPRLAMHGHVLN